LQRKHDAASPNNYHFPEEDAMDSQFEWESDTQEANQYEFVQEYEASGDTETESPFDEVQEMELAAQLLEVSDEAELDQFLGNLIRSAGRAVGTFVQSPTGRALGGILKGAAKKALPIVGGAIGSAFGGPSGGAIGSRVAAGAGRLFGLELEGLSAEDQEFEVARRYVRFAGAAARKAALTPPSTAPQATARGAVMTAARRHAPGLLRGVTSALPTATGGLGHSGRWIRRGRSIIIINC
jgi:hypothetical protein